MTVFVLKMIAVISMVFDHVGAVLIPRDMFLYALCRCIGRLAFPIFAFLLVEGFLHTKDLKKYICRMLLFAIISEIPCDLCSSGKWFYISHQNTLFLFVIGLIMLYFVQKYKHPILQLLIVGVAAGISMVGRIDYSYWGIALIYWFYCSRNLRWGKSIGVIFIYVCRGWWNIYSILSLIPILFYNGKQGPRAKWVFGLFYPLHFMVLYAIAYVIYLLP